jgi:glycosyltransferase involved in cell wall biosynthesis
MNTQTFDASVVITTYNRADALVATLGRLASQSVTPESYEVLVVDDGSTDGTYERLQSARLPYALRTFRQPQNRGIAAGRNVALREASGRYVICLSDDLLVPREFISSHLATLRSHPGYWVVGGFEQLPSLSSTPFGRYLDGLERSFAEARIAQPLEPGIWEMTWPTARNLSFPRTDLDRTGLFDEQFRNSCEDQDLAHQARAVGIRFLYDERIRSLHNDQVDDLGRVCQQQYRFAHDCALFCAKRPEVHGESPFHRTNGHLSVSDPLSRSIRKLAKSVLSTGSSRGAIERVIALAERARAPESLLFRLYRGLIGLYIFAGWRAGLRTLEARDAWHST